jgi:hypothetical protein
MLGPASLVYRYSNHESLLIKCAAYEELFGVTPAVMLYGSWKDEKGEIVFFDNGRRWHPDEMGTRGRLIAQVDGVDTLIRPTEDSRYMLTGEEG